jgi:hypothetical protein
MRFVAWVVVMPDNVSNHLLVNNGSRDAEKDRGNAGTSSAVVGRARLTWAKPSGLGGGSQSRNAGVGEGDQGEGGQDWEGDPTIASAAPCLAQQVDRFTSGL